MKLNSFQDAIKDYEQRTGEKFLWPPGMQLKVWDNNEFMVYGIFERDGTRFFYCDQTYGFFDHMKEWIFAKMRENGLTVIVTVTARDPKAHMRKFKGLKIERVPQFDYTFEGRHYFVMKGEIPNA